MWRFSYRGRGSSLYVGFEGESSLCSITTVSKVLISSNHLLLFILKSHTYIHHIYDKICIERMYYCICTHSSTNMSIYIWGFTSFLVEVGVLIRVLAPMTFSGKDGNMKGVLCHVVNQPCMT